MTAKEYMEQVRDAEEELRMLADQRQHYMALGGALAANFGGMPGVHDGHSRVEAAGVGLADLSTQISRKEAEYSKIIQQAQTLVDKLQVLNFRKVLIYHYFLGKPMKEITELMGYQDDKSAYRVRGYALAELQKLIA